MEFMHLVYHLDSKYVLQCLSPVRLVELLGCVDNVVTVVFRCKLECFQVIGLNQLFEILADYLFVHQELILGNVRNFEKHGRNHIDAVKKLKIDVHVIGDLTFHLLLLKFDGLIWNSADTLGQDLSQACCLNNIDEDFVAFFDESETESSEADLSDSSVVQNLAANVLQMNALTDMSLQQ